MERGAAGGEGRGSRTTALAAEPRLRLQRLDLRVDRSHDVDDAALLGNGRQGDL